MGNDFLEHILLYTAMAKFQQLLGSALKGSRNKNQYW